MANFNKRLNEIEQQTGTNRTMVIRQGLDESKQGFNARIEREATDINITYIVIRYTDDGGPNEL